MDRVLLERFLNQNLSLAEIGTRAAIRKVARSNADHLEVMVIGLERVVVVKVF